ncbi:MAG: amidase [Gammaproteobacteria bacterium]|nr:amidase [Gammaproteobacteria bacterium]
MKLPAIASQLGPDYGDPLCGLACEFAITRSVRDTAALLDAVAGPDVGAPGMLTAPPRPYRRLIESPPRPLRIAWTTTPPSGDKIDPECERAVHATVKLLEDLGHTLIEDRPRFDWQAFLANVHVIWTSYTAASIDALAASVGRKPGPDNLEAVTLACYEDGKVRSAAEVLNAMAHGNALSRTAGTFFEAFDVHLTPTLARPPAPLGELDQNRSGVSAMAWTEQVFNYVPFTPLFNTTGQPAISLPLHYSAEGIPIGVQFAGRFADEATLLQLAAQLEHARPWQHRRPAQYVG